MANELTKVELTNETGFPRRYTVASGVAIAKGTLLGLFDARTASGSVMAKGACAGVASMDKSASDYSTSITAWTDGIFEAVASAAITIGAPIGAEGPHALNCVVPVDTDISSGALVIGYALETASVNETINVRIKL